MVVTTIHAGLKMLDEPEAPVAVRFHRTDAGMLVSTEWFEIASWDRGDYLLHHRGDEVVIEAEGAAMVASEVDVARFMEVFA
jgi:hypothetical protein